MPNLKDKHRIRRSSLLSSALKRSPSLEGERHTTRHQLSSPSRLMSLKEFIWSVLCISNCHCSVSADCNLPAASIFPSSLIICMSVHLLYKFISHKKSHFQCRLHAAFSCISPKLKQLNKVYRCVLWLAVKFNSLFCSH